MTDWRCGISSRTWWLVCMGKQRSLRHDWDMKKINKWDLVPHTFLFSKT